MTNTTQQTDYVRAGAKEPGNAQTISPHSVPVKHNHPPILPLLQVGEGPMNRRISGSIMILIAATLITLSLAIASYSDGPQAAQTASIQSKPQGGAPVECICSPPAPLADDVAPQPVSHSTLSKETGCTGRPLPSPQYTVVF